jgi:hypothetical protein
MSNVTSRPISSKDSAIVGRARLRRQRGSIERWSALVILFASFLGTIAAMSGGWPALISAPALTPILGGFIFQGILTYLEWHYYDHKPISWAARFFDAGLTAWGYGPLVIVPLTAFLVARGMPSAEYAAWGIIGIVSFLTAWYPESRLVD